MRVRGGVGETTGSHRVEGVETEVCSLDEKKKKEKGCTLRKYMHVACLSLVG